MYENGLPKWKFDELRNIADAEMNRANSAIKRAVESKKDKLRQDAIAEFQKELDEGKLHLSVLYDPGEYPARDRVKINVNGFTPFGYVENKISPDKRELDRKAEALCSEVESKFNAWVKEILQTGENVQPFHIDVDELLKKL